MNTTSVSSLVPVTQTDASPARAAIRSMQKSLGRVLFENLSNALGTLGHLQPGARPGLYDVEVVRDVAYTDTGLRAHKLDLYKPARHAGRLPVVLYIHGGSFRVMSKESHWMMAVTYARRGYLVVNVNYRLAPQHPFPAALQDVSKAWLWVLKNIRRHGGDPGRIVIAGDSAGANLATALAIETTFRRPEPWAAEVFDAGVTPVAVVPASGILQVSAPERFARPGLLSRLVLDRIEEVRDGYVPAGLGVSTELADPLLILESGAEPERALPPFFAPVGGADPLVSDTLRLAEALRRRGVTVQAPVYAGQTHVFHAFTWMAEAKRAWADTFRFLAAHVPAAAAEVVAMRRKDPVTEYILSKMAA